MQVFRKGPHLSCTQTLHKAPSLPPPSHRSGQTEPWPQKRENRMVAFQFYYIMRCHIPHNSPYICAPGRNPEEFCLFYWICSPGTKIGIHPPRDSLQISRSFYPLVLASGAIDPLCQEQQEKDFCVLPFPRTSPISWSSSWRHLIKPVFKLVLWLC